MSHIKIVQRWLPCLSNVMDHDTPALKKLESAAETEEQMGPL